MTISTTAYLLVNNF